MTLNRTLGLTMLTFYGTGMILGAGIYSIIGQAAGIAGESLWLGFLIAALAAVLTAFSYAELATMYTKAGAEYTYLRQAFSRQPWFAGTIGIVVVFAGCASVATVSLAFASYFQHFMTFPRTIIAVVLISLFTTVNIIGIHASSWTNATFTLIEASGLVLFIWLGFQRPEFGDALLTTPNLATLSSAALIFFAFLGFENIVSLSEETKEPEKNIPRAIFLSLGISTALYVLVSLAAVALMPVEQLAISESPMIDASMKSSRNIAGVLGGIALFSTANTALIGLITVSRILYGISKDKALPKLLSRTLSIQKTPWIAALVAMGATILLLPIEKVSTLASIASFATMIVFIAVNVSLIRLRHKEPNLSRPFRVPISIGNQSVVPFLGIFICILFLFQFNQLVYWTGLAAFAGCFGIYFLFNSSDFKKIKRKPT